MTWASVAGKGTRVRALLCAALSGSSLRAGPALAHQAAEKPLPSAPFECSREQRDAHVLARAACDFLYERAREHYSRERFQRALDLFELAHSLWPDPELLYGQALSHRNLGQCARARTLYEQYVDEATSQAKRERALAARDSFEACPPSDAVMSSIQAPLDVLHGTGNAAHAWSSFQSAEDLAELPHPSSGNRVGASAIPSLVPWSLAGGAAVSGMLAGAFFMRALAARDELRSTTTAKAAQLIEEGSADQRRARWLLGIGGALGVAATVTFVIGGASDASQASVPPAELSLVSLPEGGGMAHLRWAL